MKAACRYLAEGECLEGLRTTTRLAKTVDRCCQGIVVAVADATYGGFKAGLGEALRVFDRYVLHAAIALMDEPAADTGLRS